MTMEFEIECVDPSLVICRTSGVASVEGYREMIRALVAQPGFHPGVDLITDHSGIDASSLTAGEIEQLANLRVEVTGSTARRSAMVVGRGSAMRYGLGRMFEAFIESRSGSELKVFETVEEALAWLRGAGPAAP